MRTQVLAEIGSYLHKGDRWKVRTIREREVIMGALSINEAAAMLVLSAACVWIETGKAVWQEGECG